MKLFFLGVVLSFYSVAALANPICVSRRKDSSGMFFAGASHNIICLDSSNKVQSNERVLTNFWLILPLPWNWVKGSADEDLKSNLSSIGFSEVEELSVLVSPNYSRSPDIEPIKIHELKSNPTPSSYCLISRLNKFYSGLEIKTEVYEFVSIHCPSENVYSTPEYFQSISKADYMKLMNDLSYSKVFATDDSDDFISIKPYWDLELYRK